MRLRYVIEDVNSNPKAGNTIVLMNKELRKMKVVENWEEPFKKESKTYYGHNNEDNRSRIDNWRNDLRSNGCVRSESSINWRTYLGDLVLFL